MTEETLQPEEILLMSIQLGIDMTPHEDLVERLDAVIKEAEYCSNELDKLIQRVDSYASSVQGLDKAEIQALIQESDNVCKTTI
jgi:hypothetical protein